MAEGDFLEKRAALHIPSDSNVLEPIDFIRPLKVVSIDDAQDVEVIALEEGVCRICFRMFKSEDNILKTKCICPLYLMHRECADLQWPSSGATCGVCRRDIKFIRVTILSTEMIMRNKKKDHDQQLMDHQKQSPGLKFRNQTPTSTRNCCYIL